MHAKPLLKLEICAHLHKKLLSIFKMRIHLWQQRGNCERCL